MPVSAEPKAADATIGMDRQYRLQQVLAEKNAELRKVHRLVEGLARRVMVLEECLETSSRNRGSSIAYQAVPHSVQQMDRSAEVAADLGDDLGTYFGSPARRSSSMPLRPGPGIRAFQLAGKDVPVVGVAVFGQPEETLAGIVAAVSRNQRIGPEFIPVFLTDLTRCDSIIREGYVFEYFPAVSHRRKGPTDTESKTYLRDKLLFVLTKWGIRDVLCFGNTNYPESLPSPPYFLTF